MSSGGARIVVVGSANADLHLSVDRLPEAGATVLAGETRWLPGGKGANQASAAARLGGVVSLVAAVGDDAASEVALGGLAEMGVELDHVRRLPGTPSGVAVVCVDPSGENLIVVSPGANAALEPDDVVVDGACRAVLVSLEVPTATAQAALDAAHRVGALAVLNAAPAEGVTPALLDAADILVANAGEAALLAAAFTGGTGDDIAARRSGADQGAGADASGSSQAGGPVVVADLAALAAAGTGTTVVATAGGQAVVAVTPDAADHVVPVAPVEVIDTVGAGDCFAAALTVALVEHGDLELALRFASTASGLKVGRLGARSVPTRAEVDAVLTAG